MRVCFLFVSVTFLLGHALAFLGGNPGIYHGRGRQSTVLSSHSVVGKIFQLEERQDKDLALTELILNVDNTVSLGNTDGPLPIEATGRWILHDDGKFEMELCRSFETGYDTGNNSFKSSTGPGSATAYSLSASANRIGRFHYTVPIAFRGELTDVGGKIAVEGAMVLSTQDLGDMEVGYFSLLDTSASTSTPTSVQH